MKKTNKTILISIIITIFISLVIFSALGGFSTIGKKLTIKKILSDRYNEEFVLYDCSTDEGDSFRSMSGKAYAKKSPEVKFGFFYNPDENSVAEGYIEKTIQYKTKNLIEEELKSKNISCVIYDVDRSMPGKINYSNLDKNISLKDFYAEFPIKEFGIDFAFSEDSVKNEKIANILFDFIYKFKNENDLPNFKSKIYIIDDVDKFNKLIDKSGFGSIEYFPEDLQENGITIVKEIQLELNNNNVFEPSKEEFENIIK
jgi:hypothetical protein